MTRSTKPKALWTHTAGALKPRGISKPKSRKRIRPRSKAYERKMVIYRKMVKAFLKDNPWCEVYPMCASTQNHHKYGRRGRLLLWQPGFHAVSDAGQTFCHTNIDEARALGLLGPVGTWNDYERAVKHELRANI